MRKRVVLLTLVIIMAVLMVSCSKPSTVVDKEKSAIENTEVTDKDNEEVTVVDHLNRSVTIKSTPNKIVSGYYISTSALITLGLEDKLVGIEAKADKRPIYSLAAPQLLDLPNVGTAKEFDLEGCISLNPDLVILPIKLKDQIKTLEDLGITVIGVNPENEELLNEMIVMIATLTGVKEYDEMLSYYENKEKELREIYSNNKEEQPTVYIAGNSGMLSTATKKMYQNNLIESAGGINVANDIEDAYWATISYEQLVKYNPDYIIIVPEAGYSKEDVMADNNLAGVSAIENKNVYQMPNNFEAWDSPVPSSILGKMWLASVLYSDVYTFEDFKEEVYNFYKTFYDMEIDKEVLIFNE